MVKFRGKRIDNDRRTTGYYVKSAGNHYIHRDTVKNPIRIYPKSISQFTGKFDKNDKEIYGSVEIDGKMSKGGDKVKTHIGIFPVVWSEIYLQWGIQTKDHFKKLSDFTISEIEIIDNQYDKEKS